MLALSPATTSRAADYYWDGSEAIKTWADLLNWSSTNAGGATPGSLPTAADLIYFNANISGGNITTMGADRSVLGIVFNGNATSPITLGTVNDYALTLAANGITVQSGSTAVHTINSRINIGPAQTWRNGSVNELVIGGAITGSNNLTLNDATNAGTFIFSGVNTFTGTLSITNGTVIQRTSQSAAGGVSMGGSATSNATLTIESGVNFLVGNNMSFNATATGAVINGPGTLFLNGGGYAFNVVDTAAAPIDVKLYATLGGSGSWRKENLGTMAMYGTNTFTGTNLLYRGKLILDYSINNTSKLHDTSGNTEMHGAILELQGNSTQATSELAFRMDMMSATSTISLVSNGEAVNLTISNFNRAVSTGSHIRGGAILNILNNDTSKNKLILSAGSGSANNAYSFLGGWAVMNGSRFATNSGSTNGVVALNSTTKNDRNTWLASDHILLTAAPTGALITPQIASLILDASGGTTLNIDNHAAALTVASGAILAGANNGANATSISGGQLMNRLTTSGAVGEMIITNFSTGTLTVSSNLGSSNTHLSAIQDLTLGGPGVIHLTGSNSNHRYTFINGQVRVSGGNALSDYGALVMAAGGDANTTHPQTGWGGALLDISNTTETVGSLTGGNWQGSQGAGEIRLGNTGMIVINQTTNTQFRSTVSGASGSVVMKKGSGILTLHYSPWGSFAGQLHIMGGQMIFDSGSYDAISAATGVTLRGGALLIQQANNNNKVGNNAVIRLQGTSGAGFELTNTTATTVTEQIASLQLEGGANTLTVNGSGSGVTTFQFLAGTSLVRTNGATALIRGRDLGTASRVTFSNNTAVNALLIGDAANTGTKRKILSFAVGDNTASGSGSGFLTYDTNDLRLLTEGEYVTSYSAGSFTDNLSLNTSVATAGTATYNSLRLVNTAAGVNITGTGGTLTLTSGAVLMNAGATTNSSTISGFSNIYAGANDSTPDELVLHVVSSSATAANATLTISSNISDNGAAATSITKAGNGTLKLEGTQSYTGTTTINQGVLEFATATSMGNGGAVRMGGGTLRWGAGNTADISTRGLTFLGASVYLTPGHGGNILGVGNVLDTGANNITFSSVVGGNGYGGFTKTGTGKLTFQNGINYTGITVQAQGELEFSTIAAGTTEALYMLPSSGTTALKTTVNSGMNLQSLVVGGVYDSVNTGGVQADLEVKGGIVNIGDGGGDDFILIGYRDTTAATAAAATNTNGRVDLRAASQVNINVNALQLGVIRSGANSTTGTAKGELLLSNTANTITANSILLGHAPNNTLATNNYFNPSILTLGSGTNVFNTDVFIIGGARSRADVLFNATPGSFTLRGQKGSSTGANLFIGDNDTPTQSNSIGLLNLTGATNVDMIVNLLVLGRSASATAPSAGYGEGTLTIDTGSLKATTILMADASYSAGNDNLAATRGTINQRDDAKIQFYHLSKGRGTATYNWEGGTIQNLEDADLTNQNVTINLNPASNPANDPSLRTFTVDADQVATFQANASFSGAGSLTKDGEGDLILQGTNTNTGNLRVSEGSVSLHTNGVMNDVAWINLDAAGTFSIADITATSYSSDATISGTGTIDATGKTFIVTSGVGTTVQDGVLKPGSSSVNNSAANAGTVGNATGTLNVSGNLNLAGGGAAVDRAVMQVGATDRNAASSYILRGENTELWVDNIATDFESYMDGSGTNHDHISITGSFTINANGRIVVTAYNGYQGNFGDVFNLFDWNSVSPITTTFDVGGRFRTGAESDHDLQLFTLTPDLVWDTSLFTSHGVLVIAYAPEPSRAILLIAGLTALILRRRRKAMA